MRAPIVTLLLPFLAPTLAHATPPTAADLAGAWMGTLERGGDSVAVGFEFTPDTSGRVTIAYTLPVLHFDRATIAVTRFTAGEDSVRFGPFRFAYDRATDHLQGRMPAMLFPEYDVRVSLRRGPVPAPPARPAAVSTTTPAWTFRGDSAMWAGPTFADGRLVVGSLAGTVVALDAERGTPLWSFRCGGAVRSRVALAPGAAYVHADDGVLYRLDPATGHLAWKVNLEAQPVARKPFQSPDSKFDRFLSGVTVTPRVLLAGTYDGRVVAVSPADGHLLWSHATGDAVLAEPCVSDGVVFAGSFDHHVVALDAGTGAVRWDRDTRGRVVSTPAVSGGRAIVGNRIYDLLGLDARTGEVAWSRYQWGTWIESSATARDGVAYVGSSDGACVSAWDAASGRRLWLTDVLGWSWGQPAVTGDRVYACSSGAIGYPVPTTGSVVALDRRDGSVAWRWVPAAPASGEWGFPGSVAVGPRFVYASGLDGRVVALPR
jgi:outer membrane protein assembly factor BamB